MSSIAGGVALGTAEIAAQLGYSLLMTTQPNAYPLPFTYSPSRLVEWAARTSGSEYVAFVGMPEGNEWLRSL